MKVNERGSFKRPSDEYYTTKENAENFVERFYNILTEQKTIWCPFDTDESEIVIALKKYGFKNVINTFDDFFTHNELLEAENFIFSNPPFSKMKKIIETLKKYNKDFILFDNLLHISEVYNRDLYKFYVGSMFFKNGKHVAIMYHSSLDIRNEGLLDKPIHKTTDTKTTDTINGFLTYKSLRQWIEAGKPINCYIPITGLCYKVLDYYNYKIEKPEGYFTKIFIISEV